MNIVGISVKVGGTLRYRITELDKVEIIKETSKQYNVKTSGLIFNCLTIIPKDLIGRIQSEDYISSIERKIWILEDENTNTEEIIKQLKVAIIKEIVKRKEILKQFESELESI